VSIKRIKVETQKESPTADCGRRQSLSLGKESILSPVLMQSIFGVLEKYYDFVKYFGFEWP
jgi:hypothetical protein